MPREKWPHEPGERPDEKDSWDERFGDRRQQLVFIGKAMDEPGMRRQLDACLLPADLAARESSVWPQNNPFPMLQAHAQTDKT